MKTKFYKLLLSFTCAVAVFLMLGFATSAESFREAEQITVEEENLKAEENSSEKNDFSELYTEITDNGDTIFSLCAFIGTLIIAWIYRKGLVPGLKKTVISITEALSSIKENNEQNSEKTETNSKLLEEMNLKTALISEEITRLEESVSKRDETSERRILSTLFNEQIDLLYDIFMSSSLPEYKKEEVATRISKMKETIKNEEIQAE
jgi:hypothetical protein